MTGRRHRRAAPRGSRAGVAQLRAPSTGRRYTITHLGVPLGTAELRPARGAGGDVALGALVPGPAYPVVRAALRAALLRGDVWPMMIHGRRQPPGLELRDELDTPVATDYIMIVEDAGPEDAAGSPGVEVQVQFRRSERVDRGSGHRGSAG